LIWHDAYVPVVFVIVIVVVLAAVVLVAAGRGGEMPATERSDYAPLDMGPVSATDVVLLRPPTALWGYNQQATDESLDRIAESIRERDVRIVALEQLVTDLSRQPAPPMPLGDPYTGARHARSGPGNGGPDFPDGPDSTVGLDVAGETHPTKIASAADPLAAPVQKSQEQGQDAPPWQSWAGSPPEVAH
jgi:hypothetical protein